MAEHRNTKVFSFRLPIPEAERLERIAVELGQKPGPMVGRKAMDWVTEYERRRSDQQEQGVRR